MRTAKISELKAKLSAHIQYVKNGEEVLILDRNTPVARLVPAGPSAKMKMRACAVSLPKASSRHRKCLARRIRLPRPAGRIISDEVMEQYGAKSGMGDEPANCLLGFERTLSTLR